MTSLPLPPVDHCFGHKLRNVLLTDLVMELHLKINIEFLNCFYIILKLIVVLNFFTYITLLFFSSLILIFNVTFCFCIL